MFSSLRSRQLISSFAIVMIGILVLGSMLHWFSYNYKIEQQKNDLSNISYHILGYLAFENGQLSSIPDEDMQGKLDQVIREHRLEDPEQNQFAYMIDANTSQVVWGGQNLGKPTSTDTAAQRFYLRFAIPSNTPSLKPAFYIQKPIAPKGSDQQQFPASINDKEYLLAVHNFAFPDGTGSGQDRHYQFIIGKNIEDIQREMDDLRKKFAILLFLAVVLVLIAQLAMSFWIIAPIRALEEEVKSIEAGRNEQIEQDYPEELMPIKQAVNALLNYEKGQKQRYKDTLDDLAHSLKTPLAAIQNQIDQLQREHLSPAQQQGIELLAKQAGRMHEIITHQLSRAMVSNKGAMILSQPIRPILLRLRETLLKVHRDKHFDIRINVEEQAKCRMEADDLMELFGNLLNNACRFCERTVEVSSHQDNTMLVVDIDDDGVGFPAGNPQKLLQRGVREDSKSEGQGIGLAVSTEIVSAVGGKIELLVSPQGGGRVRLHLPL